MGRLTFHNDIFAKPKGDEYPAERDWDKPSVRSMADVGNDFLRKTFAPPLVKKDGDHFSFYHRGQWVYDVHVLDAAHPYALFSRLAEKRWFTRDHLDQFASLAMDAFGLDYY
ncbi:MAG: hypothetical protein EOP20_00920 [Hyphomicrobiales bacterium]|nr:MAG: hypothetical protein EOP20_00920 [Hyphomicrobiales bacterium]